MKGSLGKGGIMTGTGGLLKNVNEWKDKLENENEVHLHVSVAMCQCLSGAVIC
jgi:hypothetical protein